MELSDIVKKFSNVKVAVIGDVMLDHYIEGSVERISQEAPTPIAMHEKEYFIPGGAANVAVNIASLGGQVLLFGLIGNDLNGKRLLKELGKRNVSADGIEKISAGVTTTKLRIVSRGHQLLRLDNESAKGILSRDIDKLFSKISSKINQIDVILISDYAKGVINSKFAKQMVTLSAKFNKPIIVDTKPENITFFKGATIIKPNHKELEAVLGRVLKDEKEIESGGQNLSKKLNTILLVTRGSFGMSLINGDKIKHFPSFAREVFDVTGAGDTVAASLALSVGARAELPHAVHISNVAAGIVVAKAGTSSVSKEELIKEI